MNAGYTSQAAASGASWPATRGALARMSSPAGSAIGLSPAFSAHTRPPRPRNVTAPLGAVSHSNPLPSSSVSSSNRSRPLRNAIARYDQVTGVSAEERALAFTNIKKAAKHYDVEMTEMNASDLGTRPSTGRTAGDRKKSGRKAVATRKKNARKKS